MTKLSIILPSRDERFLVSTIHDIFRSACGETEVVAVIDSDKWPDNWKQVTDQYPNLHTIFHGKPLGMRRAINDGVGSAISRGAKFIAKFDAHCSFSEGFDEILTSECDKDWIVVPRRGRLDADNWCVTDTHKPDIDYHYLSFPSDPNDFGGPGLNGKVWEERARERANILVDDEMSSQGSGWLMHAEFFTRMGFMDESRYGPFWNEFQELGMCAWLSGGQVKINKKCKYLHLHKGRTHGRGYRLDESWLRQGRDHTMKWIFNEAWDERQVRPFSWLIEHFWPVPSWPENWEEILYATRKPRVVMAVGSARMDDSSGAIPAIYDTGSTATGLKIHSAVYGYDHEHKIDVIERVRELVKGDSLDIVVNNSTLTPNDNPFRGKKKTLSVQYSFDGGEKVLVQRHEKDWLIIGPVGQSREVEVPIPSNTQEGDLIVGIVKSLNECDRREDVNSLGETWLEEETEAAKGRIAVGITEQDAENIVEEIERRRKIKVLDNPPQTAAALNDYLIRKFSIPPQRLRGPMPIELRDFHRNDLAQLFAELGFKRGAEIGVAEGNYSEIICKANPDVELFCIDLWESYPTNPQAKTSDRHEFAYSETKRKLAGYNARLFRESSIDAVMKFDSGELDFVYVDANHLYDFVSLDLIMWSNKVRSGGIVSGDDYYALDQKRWVGGGVVEAVQAYTNAHRIPIWYLFAGHKSVDFMWVKP